MSDWQPLLADPQITGVILAVSSDLKPAMLRAALAHEKRVLVENSPGSREYASNPGSLGVFHVRRADRDFHSAMAAVESGRLGTLSAVRFIFCEYGLPAGIDGVVPTWTETLQQTGPFLFDQLAALVNASPHSVEAWSQPQTAGFQARLAYPAGLSAWIDVQRASLNGLQTGWVLEGTAGSYRRGRLATLAADGEVLEEDIVPPDNTDHDVFADLRWLAESRQAAQESLDRAMQGLIILDAIHRSASEHCPVAVSLRPYQ
jgi:predicted dehydrogenase